MALSSVQKETTVLWALLNPRSAPLEPLVPLERTVPDMTARIVLLVSTVKAKVIVTLLCCSQDTHQSHMILVLLFVTSFAPKGILKNIGAPKVLLKIKGHFPQAKKAASSILYRRAKHPHKLLFWTHTWLTKKATC